MAIPKDIWAKAKFLFEIGKSLNDISLETDIPKGTISKKSKKENWEKRKIDLLKEYQINKKTHRIISDEFNIDINVIKDVLNNSEWYSNEELENHINSYPLYLAYKLMQLSKLELILIIESVKNEIYFGLEENVSKGHLKVRNVLKELDISFEEEKTFEDLKNINPLRFDFYIKNKNIAIEFQGKQHFEPVDIFGGKESYKKQVINDGIKRRYCKENNIKLVEIGYFDFMIIKEILIKEVLNG